MHRVRAEAFEIALDHHGLGLKALVVPADQVAHLVDKHRRHAQAPEYLARHGGADLLVSSVMAHAALVRRLGKGLADIMEQHGHAQERLGLDVVHRGDRMAVEVAVVVLAVLFKVKSTF